jgi:hypothetical protein
MQSVYNFIVSPKEGRSTSEKKINGKKLLLNTEVQNHHYTSRLGVVNSVPKITNSDIQEGDEIIVHHNVFRRFRDVRGKEKNSRAFYKEDMFFVYPDQVYAYKRNSEWNALPGFCFVKPIKAKDKFSLHKEEPLIGIIKYASEGFEAGALVGFKPGMEYEFNIEGERLYRVPANQITVEYEYQGNEEEYNPSWSQSC